MCEHRGLIEFIRFDSIAGEFVRFERAAAMPLERVAFVAPRRDELARDREFALSLRNIPLGGVKAHRENRETPFVRDELHGAATNRLARWAARLHEQRRSHTARFEIDYRALCEREEMHVARIGKTPRGSALARARKVECDLMGIPKSLHVIRIATKGASGKAP